ncbi:MAG: hypothetical protein A2521_17020 [Deltaproteobacteria bacterium RIFOXYD12_FULL_57_12]|nr:MAG: hypothetical protein A2521_17020 [Deltaproteobacteria bacterium RIFOXYD12_FULL_57_12]
MAGSQRKKKVFVRFELSFWGLLGVAVVCFCIFLWMFLLGIWAGQTILVTSSPETSSFLAPAPIAPLQVETGLLQDA